MIAIRVGALVRTAVFRSLRQRRMAPGSHRLFDRRTLWREHLRPCVGDVQTVLETNPELAIDHDRRLVAEAHSRLNLGRIPTDEIRPFVAVETDTMPGAMRKTWNLVVGTKPRAGDDFSRRGVHRLARRADLRGGQGGALYLALPVALKVKPTPLKIAAIVAAFALPAVGGTIAYNMTRK